MCFDGTSPAADALMRAAAEHRREMDARDLPERLRGGADDQYAAAALIELLRGELAEQARLIERLRARLHRAGRGGKGEG